MGQGWKKKDKSLNRNKISFLTIEKHEYLRNNEIRLSTEET